MSCTLHSTSVSESDTAEGTAECIPSLIANSEVTEIENAVANS